jgi:hypothetical protein
MGRKCGGQCGITEEGEKEMRKHGGVEGTRVVGKRVDRRRINTSCD